MTPRLPSLFILPSFRNAIGLLQLQVEATPLFNPDQLVYIRSGVETHSAGISCNAAIATRFSIIPAATAPLQTEKLRDLPDRRPGQPVMETP